MFHTLRKTFWGGTGGMYYATKDGLTTENYQFSFEQQSDGTWRAYIVKSPSYGSRSTSLLRTHRLTDNERYYVCWDDPVRSKEEMMVIVAIWSDATQAYLKYGSDMNKTLEQLRSSFTGVKRLTNDSRLVDV